MEDHQIAELENELNHIDVDSLKLDAVISLKRWQKKMHTLIDKTYKDRLNEIETIASNRTSEIKEKQNKLRCVQINTQNEYRQLKREIKALKSNIIVQEFVPDNFSTRVQRTVRISKNETSLDEEMIDDDEEEEDDDDDDDAPIIIDVDRDENENGKHYIVGSKIEGSSAKSQQGTVSKVFNSYPVQHALAVGLAKTLTNVGTVAATTTTTVAVTTMAKTAIIATACGIGTVAYGAGKLALGTTKRVYSLIFSSDD